jgi:hypothetical protein
MAGRKVRKWREDKWSEKAGSGGWGVGRGAASKQSMTMNMNHGHGGASYSIGIIGDGRPSLPMAYKFIACIPSSPSFKL